MANPAPRIRLVPGFPLSVANGGFEHQCIQTQFALRAAGCDARILDWSDAKDSYDVMHFFGASGACAGMVDELKCRVPFVVSVLSEPRFPGLMGRAQRVLNSCTGLLKQQTSYGLARKILLAASAVIMLNEAQREATIRFYKLDPRRVSVIQNGVSESRFVGNPALLTQRYQVKDYVLYVGNIIQRKNPLLLAELLHKRGWSGVFIGGVVPSDREYAARFGKFVEGAANLKWIPSLEYNDPLLDSAFAGAKLLCLPSSGESQPLVALEAMAAGLPVVMPDLPYARHAPFTGVSRFQLGAQGDLEKVLGQILDNPAAYRQRLDSKFKWSEVARQLTAVYQNVIMERNAV